jgi:hypothetical protein
MLHNAFKSLWPQACNKENNMKSWPYLLIFLATFLAACSPSDPAIPKIAEEPREVMKNAEGVSIVIEQSAQGTLTEIAAQTE